MTSVCSTNSFILFCFVLSIMIMFAHSKSKVWFGHKPKQAVLVLQGMGTAMLEVEHMCISSKCQTIKYCWFCLLGLVLIPLGWKRCFQLPSVWLSLGESPVGWPNHISWKSSWRSDLGISRNDYTHLNISWNLRR